MPISKIKIDRGFVKDIVTNSQNRAITLAIITLARELNLKVIAEGVENEQEFNFLRNQQVDGIQGFYLSEPLAAASCEQLLAKLLI